MLVPEIPEAAEHAEFRGTRGSHREVRCRLSLITGPSSIGDCSNNRFCRPVHSVSRFGPAWLQTIDPLQIFRLPPRRHGPSRCNAVLVVAAAGSIPPSHLPSAARNFGAAGLTPLMVVAIFQPGCAIEHAGHDVLELREVLFGDTRHLSIRKEMIFAPSRATLSVIRVSGMQQGKPGGLVRGQRPVDVL